MRFTSITKKTNTQGFTLIEILIIAPIVILAISVFISLIINMVGDVLAVRDRNNMSYEIRDTLDRIEQDSRLSTQFLTTSSALLSPQGSDNNFTGTAAFSNTNSLIMGTLTTDKNPVDSSRQLIFYAKQPNDCGSLQSYNRPFISKIIYFIKDNSLWRRTYILPYNTNASPNDETLCNAPWQQNSCSPGYSLATRCQTNDMQLMQNVTSFNVKYFSSPSSTTDIGAANALNATTIEVTLNGQKLVAGRTVNNTGSVRTSKLNAIDADLPIPGTPTVSGQISAPNTLRFSWPIVPAATSYLISYNINGGSWIDATNDSTTTFFEVPAYRNDTVTMRVTAKNSSGSSPYGQAAATIPAWYTPTLQNGWVPFDTTPGSYSTPAYTKTNANIIALKGVIRDGNANLDTTIMTLPVGYRPTHRLVFQTESTGQASRIDVLPNGEVRVNRATSGWITLDNIRFVSSTATYTWTTYPAPFQNGWTNYSAVYGGDWAPFRSTLDSVGRAHLQGLLHGGTNVNPTTMVTLAAGHQSPEYAHWPASSTGFNLTAFAGPLQAKGISNASDYYSIQAMFYPTTAGWTTLSLQNSWTVFDSGHSQNRYRKAADGMVTLKGLIKNGNTNPGTVVATLPAGFRPSERLCFAALGGFGHARFDVLPNGQIIISSGAQSVFSSLDGISFMAEQ